MRAAAPPVQSFAMGGDASLARARALSRRSFRGRVGDAVEVLREDPNENSSSLGDARANRSSTSAA